MKNYIYILPIILSALIICDASSELRGDSQKVIWIKSHYPPYYITRGPDAGTGIADNLERLLQKELTGYKHDSLVANWRRVLKEMKLGNNVVSLTLLKTPEREAYIEYSTLTYVTPSNGICVRADDAKFSDITSIYLRTLLEKKNFKVGIMHGRAYGKGIDPLLKMKKYTKNMYVRTSADGVEGLMLLLMKKRIDAVICYSYESTWIARKIGLQDRIKQLRVLEQEPLAYVYAGAPKSDWGKKIIREIDEIYKKNNIVQKTSVELEPYLDENTVKWYREEVKKLMNKRGTEK